jgi:glycosyltransferase involved in cell wall biosynthesis
MFLALVPAYNEEKRIEQVLQGLFLQVDSVVVIDDASTDNTVEVAERSGAIVLRHEMNRGQGAALETGHEYARQVGADYVIHFDADGQFSVSDIAPALEKIQSENADILFGSRFLEKKSNVPWSKKYIIFPLGKIVNLIFGSLPLSDVHNGFRILGKNALEKIRITQDRMAHATEIPVLAKKHNLQYVEFPVEVTYHEYGQGGLGGVKIVKDLFTGKFID